jgi:hypothetical protein
MDPTSKPPADLVLAGQNLPSSFPSQLPLILSRAGQAAVFATEEFFFGRIRNEHTRSAYLIAVKRFLAWAESRGLELSQIAPKDVGIYIDGLREQNTSVSTRKQHLAALRHYFDGLVTRHAILLNPALSVRGERYQVVEGKTPEITVDGARTVLKANRYRQRGQAARPRHCRHSHLHRLPRRRRGHPQARQFLSCWQPAHAAL